MQRSGVEILGMEELRTILRELPQQVSYKIVLAALRKSAVPLQSEAVSLAPSRRGVLKKAMVIKGTREQEPAVYVAPTQGKNVVNDAFYAKFQEFGTKGFGRRKQTTIGMAVNFRTGGYYSKKKTVGYKRMGAGLPALHFMLRAFDAKKDVALGMINEELSKKVVSYLRRKAPQYYAA